MRFLRSFINRILYALSYLMPRDRHLWIFVGWRQSKEREVFAENPKYQFLYVAHHEKRVRPIWIGMDEKICALLREHGFEAYPRRSLRGAYYSLRAGYTFVGGLLQPQNWKFAGGTRLIQLWHGKSLKKTGFMSPYGLKRRSRLLMPYLFKQPHRFAAISSYLSDFIVTDFHVPKERILMTGIPKHDIFFRDVPGSEIDRDEAFASAIQKMRSLAPRRLILYAPTFRPDGADPLAPVDFAKLNAALADVNDRMIVILHPKFAVREWRREDLSHIAFCQNDRDAYPLLSSFDVVVSDYSSLALEFLMMGKPAILFAYDVDSFKQGMGLYEELWDAMPGPKVYSFDELLLALRSDLSPLSPAIERSRAALFEFTDGRAAERITEALIRDARHS